MEHEDGVFQIEIPDSPPLILDLREIYALEARKGEIVSVSKVNGGSLLRAMEDGYQQSGTMLAMVSFKLTEVELAIKRRKAFIKLDIVPQVLQEKGLATARSPGGAKDLREDIMATDMQLQALENAEARLTSMKEILRVKVNGFQMTYSGVKRVIDDKSGTGGFTPPPTPKY